MTRARNLFAPVALRALHRMSRAIAAAGSMEDVCERLLAEVIRVIPVTKASIMKFDPASRTLRIVAAHGLPRSIARTARVTVGEGISGRVFAASRPLLVKDVRSLKGVQPRRRYRGRSLMVAPVTCWPMKVGTTPIGVINMADKRDGTPFTPQDLELLTTIANQVAAYLHLSDLAEEVDRSRHNARELAMARAIQQRLRPMGDPRLPGLRVAYDCLTSAHVGGDYIDFFVGDRQTPGIVIADVAGHDVGAALTMAAVRSLLRAEASRPAVTSAGIVERVNRHLAQDLAHAEQFVSMLVLQYLPDEQVVRYCVAGHPSPLWCRRATRTVQPLVPDDVGDGVLGVDARTRFHDHRVVMQHGDVLLLFTDGLTGARNDRGNAFGTDRLCRLLRSLVDRHPRAILDQIRQALRRHVGAASLTDDVGIVVVKIKG